MTEMTPTSTEAWSIAGYGRAEDLRLGSLPVTKPGPREILVEMDAASLNPFDLKMIAGDLRKTMPTSFPYVPGNDVCGHVVAKGEAVEDYEVGDRVIGFTPHNGGMAKYVICAEGPSTAHAPDGPSAGDLAALPETGLTALAILRAADLRPGDDVMIIGATGGVGLLLCQLASNAGVHVVATATADDEQLARSNGAEDTIDHTKNDVVEILRARRPEGVRVVIDLINSGDALIGSASAVTAGGKLISTLSGPEANRFPNGISVIYLRFKPKPGDLDQLIRSVTDGSLRPNVTATYAFSDVPQAYLSLRDGHVRGKIVVLN